MHTTRGFYDCVWVGDVTHFQAEGVACVTSPVQAAGHLLRTKLQSLDRSKWQAAVKNLTPPQTDTKYVLSVRTPSDSPTRQDAPLDKAR